MNRRKGLKRRSLSTLLACCLIVAPCMVISTMALSGCDAGAGFLGLQDYQRDLLFGIGSLALGLLGGGTPDDGVGQDITPGCTIEDNEDGSSTITCIQVNADGSTTSTSVTVRSGESSVCTITDNEDGTSTITCDDGTTVTVHDGDDGTDGTSCSVTDNPNDTITISCTDGTSATFEEGSNGSDGSNGRNGRDGESCRLEETDTEIKIICGEDTVIIKKFVTQPLFNNLFIDAFFTPTGGSFTAAREADVIDPVQVFEPSMGDCGVETVAYKMGVPQRYNLSGDGNPITMRLYLYRTGPTDEDCMVLRLDSFRAVANERILTYGGTRYLKLDTSQLVDGEGLLVVDLPLNNGSDLTKSLGFPTPGPSNLLAFELNVVDNDRFYDGGCYTMLGVDFFESEAGDPNVQVVGATEITESLNDITMCGDCPLSEFFEDGDTEDLGDYGFFQIEADPDDVAVVGGMLQLRDDGDPDNDPGTPQTEAQAIVFDVDVSAYSSLNLTLKWTSLGANFASDRFYVQWRPCTDDTPIPTDSEVGDAAYFGAFSLPVLVNEQLNTGPIFPNSDTLVVPLPQGAIDAGCIDLRFFTVVSNPLEGALIDFIDLCGELRQPTLYTCDDGECIEDSEGEYASLAECEEVCQVPTGFECNGETCVEVPGGEYATFEECSSNCLQPVVGYTCTSNPARGEAGIGGCQEDPNGEYATLDECEAACARFSCEFDTNGGFCVPDDFGPYTGADCEANICNPDTNAENRIPLVSQSVQN